MKERLATLTACGECCTGCKKKLSGDCPGCIEADGYVPEWAQSGRCRIHACTRDHSVTFCGLCELFPCDRIGKMIHWVPDAADRMRTVLDEING